MKVYAEVKPEGKCPVTVREGRVWLSNLLGETAEYNQIDDPKHTEQIV